MFRLQMWSSAGAGRDGRRRLDLRVVLSLCLGCLFFACGTNPGARFGTMGDGVSEEGIASFYHDGLHGNPTASGELYDRNALTAAHPALPFGTRIRVTNLRNGRSLVLTVNDRGPFVTGRIVDVSQRAARELDFLQEGIVKVTIAIVD